MCTGGDLHVVLTELTYDTNLTSVSEGQHSPCTKEVHVLPVMSAVGLSTGTQCKQTISKEEMNKFHFRRTIALEMKSEN